MARLSKAKKEYQTHLFKQTRSPKEALRDVRNYLAGQFIGATKDDALLDEVLKCLFCKLLIEKGEYGPIDVSGDPFALAKQIRTIFATVRSEFPDIYESGTEILLDPTALAYVMFTLDFSVMDANSDPIGDAFEIFVGSESKGNAGQFFTPRSVTNLLVAALVTSSHDRSLKLWELNESRWELKDTLEGHEACVRCVAFNHDGSQIISGSDDTVVKIWEPEFERVEEVHASMMASANENYDAFSELEAAEAGLAGFKSAPHHPSGIWEEGDEEEEAANRIAAKKGSQQSGVWEEGEEEADMGETDYRAIMTTRRR